MKELIWDIDESNEKLHFLSVIEKSKELIYLNSISEEFRLETKNKLLSCIEECSVKNIDNNILIEEILNIFSDEILLDNLSDKDKAKLYVSLWDNYFSLWDIDLALDNYKKSFELWNIEIFKQILFVSIYQHVSIYNWDVDLISDIEMSVILESINLNKWNINYLNELEADLEEFFVWWIDYVQKSTTLFSYIYNLEVSEEISLRYISKANWLSKDLLKKDIDELKFKLTNAYNELISMVEVPDLFEIARDNMIKRLSWDEVDYMEYSSYFKEFISTWFDLSEVYFNLWESDKWFAITNFLLWVWFTNLWDSWKWYIVETLKEVIEDDIKMNLKNKIDHDKLNYLLFKNINNWIPSFDTMVDLWDVFVLLWYHVNALNCYLAATEWMSNAINKIENLLEDLLLKKDFSNISLDETKVNPEMIISLLIEKINNGKTLNRKDIDDLYYVCRVN